MSVRYLRPHRLTEALDALATFGARASLLAGGTDLVVRMRRGISQPEAIIDLSLLQELRGIQRDNQHLSLGALVTYREIEQCRDLAEWAPVLLDACHAVGAPQIRSRGTIGGNVANASPAGDSLPPLYVLDASIQLVSRAGARSVPIAEFFTGPGKTVRRPDELIQSVRCRVFESGERGYFRKIGERQGMFIAKVSVASTLVAKGDVVQRCRIALGAVAPTVIRVPAAEEYLAGRRLTAEAAREAGRLAMEVSRPITDIRSTASYRRHLVRVLVERGLRGMAGTDAS